MSQEKLSFQSTAGSVFERFTYLLYGFVLGLLPWMAASVGGVYWLLGHGVQDLARTRPVGVAEAVPSVLGFTIGVTLVFGAGACSLPVLLGDREELPRVAGTVVVASLTFATAASCHVLGLFQSVPWRPLAGISLLLVPVVTRVAAGSVSAAYATAGAMVVVGVMALGLAPL